MSSEMSDAVKRAQADPVWWTRTILGDDPWARQEEIMCAVRDHPEVAVKSSHGTGKSWDAARLALWFLCCYPSSLVVTTAPTNRQVKNILWREIRTAHARAAFPLGGKLLTQQLEFADDWFALGFTAPEYDPERFQGLHQMHVLVIIDEAAGVSKTVRDGITGLLSGAHTRLLEIGNPTDPTSGFADSFRSADVHKISISAFDTPNFTTFGITETDIEEGTWEAKVTGDYPYPALVTPAWVANRYRRWRPLSPQYQSRVLAQFPEESDDTLIPLRFIEAAVERTLEPVGDVELGVDPARYGPDESVIYRRQGPVFRLVDTWGKAGAVETQGRITAAWRKTGAVTIKVEENGLGGPIADNLEGDGVPIEKIDVAGGAYENDEYGNLRAEMYFALAERAEDGSLDLDPEDDMAAAQLASLRYKFGRKGLKFLESKDEMKARRLPSSDRADAIAIANIESGSRRAVFHVW